MVIDRIDVDNPGQMKKYPQLASQVRGIPATFILDSKGNVVGQFTGGTDLQGVTQAWKQATKRK